MDGDTGSVTDTTDLADTPDMLILRSIPCRAVVLPSAGGFRPRPGAAPAGLTREDAESTSGPGAHDLLSALVFDLTELPLAAGVLYAGIEFAGLSEAVVNEYGEWSVRLIDLACDATVDDATWRSLAAAPSEEVGGGWRLRTGPLRSMRRSQGPRTRSAPRLCTLELGRAVLAEIARRVGCGSVVFRVDGPAGRGRIFVWPTEGPFAPRLRLGYVTRAGKGAVSDDPLARSEER
jgi:hypothetical protein